MGHIVANILAGDFQVRVADWAKPEERGVELDESIEFLLGDLRESGVAKRVTESVDVVVHLAANIGSMNYMKAHQAEIMRDNCAIDAALYPAMAESKVSHVVYSSSSMVHQHSLVFPYKESDVIETPAPSNVYGFSKLAGEYFCRAYQKQYGVGYTILRYHNIFGPGESSKGETPGDIHVLPALVEKVLSGQYPVELLGGEKATRPFTHIDDAVRATVELVKLAAAGDRRVMNEDFNVGPNTATAIVDLAELVWQELGDGREFEYVMAETETDTAVRREMDAGKLAGVLGWEIETDLRAGIREVGAWVEKR